ncbi:MAG: hypothetical protein ABFS56_13720, partial [Pseudomonadota bacterium]
MNDVWFESFKQFGKTLINTCMSVAITAQCHIVPPKDVRSFLNGIEPQPSTGIDEIKGLKQKFNWSTLPHKTDNLKTIHTPIPYFVNPCAPRNERNNSLT